MGPGVYGRSHRGRCRTNGIYKGEVSISAV